MTAAVEEPPPIEGLAAHEDSIPLRPDGQSIGWFLMRPPSIATAIPGATAKPYAGSVTTASKLEVPEKARTGPFAVGAAVRHSAAISPRPATQFRLCRKSLRTPTKLETRSTGIMTSKSATGPAMHEK